MDNRVLIKLGPVEVEAVLNDGETARAIWENLPIESIANLWGNEIYFETEVVSSLEDMIIPKINPGDICYWPTGRAICIFFGPTPLSQGQEIVPAGSVNIIGKVIGDIECLKQVEEREIVKIIARNLT